MSGRELQDEELWLAIKTRAPPHGDRPQNREDGVNSIQGDFLPER